MKKLIPTTLLFCLYHTFLFGQTESQVREVGFLVNTHGIGTTYRFGNQESLWNIRLMVNELDFNEFTGPTGLVEEKRLNMGIHFGREWRKQKMSKLTIRYGMDVGFEYENNRLTNDLCNKIV